MRFKPLFLIGAIVLISALAISYAPLSQDARTRQAARRLGKTLQTWKALQFLPITNQTQRADAAAKILDNTTKLPPADEPFSRKVLLATLTELLKAFGGTDCFEFKGMTGRPDFDNYRHFRGFDLAESIEAHWSLPDLPGRKQKITPAEATLIRQLFPPAQGIAGNGQDETPEALHLLTWVAAIFNRPRESDRIPAAEYCNGHWVGINVSQAVLDAAAISPGEFLQQRPNCGIKIHESSFDVAFPAATNHQLLFSATVQLDCGLEAHPVAIALRWHPKARRWIPTTFAVASTINGIGYVW